MKIYLLYSDPYDEGADIYGAFSTEERVNRAHEIFSVVSKYELYVGEYELDEIEKYFERAQSGYRHYLGHKERYRWDNSISYKEWSWTVCGLDDVLSDDIRTYVVEFERYVSAIIYAKSQEEAEEIANKIFQEKKDGYFAWEK